MEEYQSLINAMPKAELHMHLEGSIEPELMFAMARRNGIALPYSSVQELRAAFDFTDLQSFLDLLYAGNDVLQVEQDFFEMTWSYLSRAHADRILRAEMFLTPQAHVRRGIAFEVMLDGVLRAMELARHSLGISAGLLIGFQRHRSEKEAFEIFEMALPYRDRILGAGLGGAQAGNPPSKFRDVFGECRRMGWRIVAHAGEEGPPEYIEEALDVLRVERIDHGVRCEEDPALVKRLAEMQIPLTVCPLSNVKLRVFPSLESHNLKRLLRSGLRVTVNSDDPTQFGGYVNDNYSACQAALQLSRDDIHSLAENGFLASFVSDAEKAQYCESLEEYWQAHPD